LSAEVLPLEDLAGFCRRWKIVRLERFGSALSGELRPESDSGFMVSFSAEASWSLLDHVRMEEEMASLLGRRADIVTRRAVERCENRIRRRSILDSARTVYAEAR
jgi:predicted nucleotidyltransferase